MHTDEYSVLVVTKDTKISSTIGVMLQPPMFEVSFCSDLNEGRRFASEKNYDIIIADSGDGSGIDFAVDVSSTNASVLLLVPELEFDQISYRVEGFGILTLIKNFEAFYFYNMIKVAIAVQYKIQILTSQAMKLKDKMEEVKIINRAKMLLMQNRSMTEEEAHKFIEKQAMDRCIKKIAVAREVIEDEA